MSETVRVTLRDLERFASKIAEDAGCWLWTATGNQKGYGFFHHGHRMHTAHRWTYEVFIGPIPDGLVLDHLCRQPRCVNPRHLEPVTNRENILRGEGVAARCARQTHCAHGHPLVPENLTNEKARRRCRICRRAVLARHRAKRKAVAA